MQNLAHEGMQKKKQKWIQSGCKKDANIDQNKGIKVEANMSVKGGATRVDVQTRHKIRCKTRLKTRRKT